MPDRRGPDRGTDRPEVLKRDNGGIEGGGAAESCQPSQYLSREVMPAWMNDRYGRGSVLACRVEMAAGSPFSVGEITPSTTGVRGDRQLRLFP
jgi:hypothetical protein